MRVVPCMLLLAAVCLAGPGCSLFNKKSGGGSGGSSIPPPKFPGGPAGDPIKDGTVPLAPPQSLAPAGSTEQAVLAGRVIDSYQRPLPNTYIRWVRMEENREAGAPIDVEATPDGYFTIPGLKPDAQYKLIARSKQGDKVLAGINYTRAPNVNVYITVKEEFASVITPAGPAAVDTPKDTPAKTSADLRNQPASAWTPTPAVGNVSAVNNAVPDLPMQLNVPVPTSQQAPAPGNVTPPTWTPAGVAGNGNTPAWPPALNIANPRPAANATPPPPNPPQPPALNPGDGKLSHSTPRIPSCVLVGKQLYNLALNDTNGGTWEYRTSKRGKLVLLDFWATYCGPCRLVMPSLNRLQSQYGSQGLEVIGITMEKDGTIKEQADRVNLVCRGLKVNYRQLLGEPKNSNLSAEFGAAAIPKLVLLDEHGTILWEHVGAPDAPTLAMLETMISRRLTTPAS